MSLANPGEMRKRDQFKHNRPFDEYKKQRNLCIEPSSKSEKYFCSQLVKDNRDTSSIWTAINSITQKNSKTCNISASNIPPDSFNNHFLCVHQTTSFLERKLRPWQLYMFFLPDWLLQGKARTLSCISYTTTHCLWSRRAYYRLNKQKTYGSQQYTHISA